MHKMLQRKLDEANTKLEKQAQDIVALKIICKEAKKVAENQTDTERHQRFLDMVKQSPLLDL